MDDRKHLDALMPLFEFFKERCIRECENRGLLFAETSFYQLLKRIGSDTLLQAYFIFTYAALIPRKASLQIGERLKKIEDPFGQFAAKMYKLRNEWAKEKDLYLDVFEDDCVRVWGACRKIEAGDSRSFNEIYSEMLPKVREIHKNDTMSIRLELLRDFPNDHLIRDEIYHTAEGEKWITGIHYFGIDHKDRRSIENFMHRFMRDYLSASWQILPQRSQAEHLLHFHTEPLPREVLTPNIMWDHIEGICEKAPGIPLAWAPKFINLIRAGERQARKMALKNGMADDYGIKPARDTLADSSSFPSSYSAKYWLFAEDPDNEKNIVSFHFLGAIEKLPRCDSEDKLPGYLKTVFWRDLRKFFGREKDKEKALEKKLGSKPKYFEDLHHFDKEGREREERIEGGILPTIEPINLDELFPDPVDNYIANHFSQKNMVKDAAKRFGKSVRTIQRRKKRVEEILDMAEGERLAHLSVYIPGIEAIDSFQGELMRVAALRYRKPHYKKKAFEEEKREFDRISKKK